MSGYGKYGDRIGEKLHAVSMDGCDSEFGDVGEPPCRWWGLILGSGIRGAQNAIITESDQGFFVYQTFRSRKQAQAAFDSIVAEVTAEMHEYHEQPEEGCELCEEAAEEEQV